MFFPGSRYFNLTTYQATTATGAKVTATRLPLPLTTRLQGYYPRQNSQRLDQIASYFLSDATTFWQLCDGNDSVAPDALAVQSLVGIPGGGGS
jgi:hypothetical protein